MGGKNEETLGYMRNDTETKPDTYIEDRIRHLMAAERFGVLCTQGDGQPYGSLMALGYHPSLTFLVFATPRATLKYQLLKSCPRVACVIDSRDKYPDDVMKAEALTITGYTEEIDVQSTVDGAVCRQLFMSRHQNLEAFINDPKTALFKLYAEKFLYVTHFQETYVWHPPASH